MNAIARTSVRRFKPATLVLALSLAAAGSAHAQIFRAYVSSTGNDANNCTLVAPCRLLPAALAAVATGGEIWMLDSANYNTSTVVVNKSVTILAVPGVVGSVVGNASDAMHVNVNAGVVALRNLVFVQMVGSSSYGIRVLNAQRVSLERSVIANFGQIGLNIESAGTSVSVTDSTVRNNTSHCLAVSNAATLTVSRSTLSGCKNGVFVLGNGSAITQASISDSLIHSNSEMGVQVSSQTVNGARASVAASQVLRNNVGLGAVGVTGSSTIVAQDNLVADNTNVGISASVAGASIRASGNAVFGNGIGIARYAGIFETGGNNMVRGNDSDVFGTGINAAALQ